MAIVVARLLLFQSGENLAGGLQQVRVVAAVLQFQHQRVPVFAAAQQLHGLLPVDGAAFRGDQREEVVVVLAVVVVHVGGADALLHQLEFVRYARAHVGVARIEHVVHADVGQFLELDQLFGAGEFVGNVLQQNLHAAPAANRLSSSSALQAASNLRMSNSSPPTPMCWIMYLKGMVSAISRARLISSTMCRRVPFTGSVMLMTACGPERPQISSVYMGECSECSFKSESRNQWPSSAIWALSR